MNTKGFRFRGLTVALATPFHADGVDEQAFEEPWIGKLSRVRRL